MKKKNSYQVGLRYLTIIVRLKKRKKDKIRGKDKDSQEMENHKKVKDSLKKGKDREVPQNMKSNSSNMIWKIDQLISKASTFFTIKIGDIMFTGTPEGVGKVVENDLLEGYIDDKKVFSVRVK